MKRAMIILGMLLLASVISCQKADTNEPPAGDADVKKEAVGDPDADDKIVTPLAECEALLDEARKTGFASGDLEAAWEAWDKAAAGLQNHMYTVDQARWLEMQSEVKKARERLRKMQTLRNITTAVDNARKSGDSDRLLAALETAKAKSHVPPKLVEAWDAEIKKIQESLDFIKITRLVVKEDTRGALEALDVFIRKYPENLKAQRLKEDLQKREAKKARQ
ncbi:MAG: hypothetical protein QGH60_09905 [Phycisphaerae bacterium]|jgi:hypothetical protein|nr:hypothetical protein [Phycisphaerae bacterium]